MGVLFHASPVAGIKELEPRVSNHGIPQIYFSRRRENVLVYLCNAIEKYCKETGFAHEGNWQKWGPYGFNKDGSLRLEEYYPDALRDTYQGVSAYIYTAEESPAMQQLEGIRDAVTADVSVPVTGCEFVPDAYEAIMQAYRQGQIDILFYKDMTPQMLAWNEKTIPQEYLNAADHPEYRHFLKGKFPELLLGEE